MADLLATVSIHNQTDLALRRVAVHLIHGKWTDDQEPTENIGPRGRGVIKSRKRSGAWYGTEGDCTYVLIENGEPFAKLYISWCLPFGNGYWGVKAEVGVLSYRASAESKYEQLKWHPTTLTGTVTLEKNG